jgi:penicillin-insensitive murein endopeptidase
VEPPGRRLLAALRIALVASVCALGGCVAPGFFTDFSSVSLGTFNDGVLRHGTRLPPKGDGYLVPPLWKARGNQWGTDELVAAIKRAARRVHREYPGGVLGIGDLSQRGGGDSLLHRSHENGRDADLIYFAVDDKGRPVGPVDSMPRYGADLRALPPHATQNVRFGPFSPRRFDVRRNWALVRALLQDPGVEVQYLFCNELLKARMLEYARAHGEDAALVDRAEELLHQPGDSLPHDDHLHLRIYCSASDRAFGCEDRGPTRWWKKRWKYLPPFHDGMSDVVDELARIAAPFVRLRGMVL